MSLNRTQDATDGLKSLLCSRLYSHKGIFNGLQEVVYLSQCSFRDTQGSEDAQWVFQGPDFLAWTDLQEFTVPLYRFYAEATKDYLYTTSTDSNPPSFPGFSFQTIVAYVYRTQVCGSVPLLGLWDKTNGDYFYTTSQPEHTTFLTRGPWVDTGIAAYVLPVSSGMLTDGLLFEH
ncbi:hypothetical protein CVT25_002830 [Psilocybe cyanescens]|uniref:DUF5648 domain-containing protein n=1 Tax=Psilocybe cyanescens TaxID=93625 RepID=A0A409WL39_PSICY|nr:hypothetical protein CVT25_002830 [Psilocybe cyanescens]